MPIAALQYTEGTIKNPQHTKASEACFTETNLVHFPDGKLTPIPTFIQSAFSGSAIKGTVRSQWAATLLTENYQGAHYLFGASGGLYSEYGGVRRNITPLKTTEEATLGTDPLAVVDTTPTITVTYTAHGLAIGDRIKLTGATDTGGILAVNINKEHIVVAIPTANTFTITAGSNATSTVSGGGSAIDIFKEIAAGNEYQILAFGCGAGVAGLGAAGASQTSASTFLFPRIWSFDNFGGGIVMCAGDYDAGDGQKIYDWAGDYNVAPAVMTDAPIDCQFVFVLNGSIIALCGTNIKIAGLDDVLAPIWSGLGYNEIPVQGSNRLLSGFKVGDRAAIVFAPAPYLLTLDEGIPSLVELGEEYAIAAPMACCKLEDGLIWYGINGNFYFFNGSTVQTIINEQNGEYIRSVISQSSIHTTFMMADQKHNQAWLYYPTTGNQNPNEYVIINPRRYSGAGKPSFTLGEQTRTSAQRPNIIQKRFYMFEGDLQYTAFTTQPRNFAWSAKTAFMYLGAGNRVRITDIQPEFFQAGNVDVAIYGLEGVQGEEVNYGEFEVALNALRVTTPAAGQLVAFVFSGNSDATIITMRINFNLQGGRSR